MDSQRQASAIEIGAGVRAAEVVAPLSAGEVASILSTASADNRTVIPYGGARSLVTGHPVDRFDIALDVTQLAGVLDHEPADLVLSVRAGTMVSEIQAVLGQHNQELPIDVPMPDRTSIGGLIATGFAGPRRLRSGSLRDLLIGCEYVRGDGLLAKAGGMVVKNVSGFEIPRFLHGSWGALAVLTSVNLKIMPKPRADGTLTTDVDSLDRAVGLAQELIASEPSLDAGIVSVDRDGVRLSVRALGRERAVAEILAACRSLTGQGTILNGEESAAFWQSMVEEFAESEEAVVVAASTRPRFAGELAGKLLAAAASIDDVSVMVSPGLGSVRMRWSADGANPDALGAIVSAANGRHIIECSPPQLRAASTPWGLEPGAIEVMRAIKREFDPAGILNRARLFV